MKPIAWQFEHNGIARIEWALSPHGAAKKHAYTFDVPVSVVLERLVRVGHHLNESGGRGCVMRGGGALKRNESTRLKSLEDER